MKVHFTRTLHIGKDYFPAGEQDVPEATLKQPFFAKHIKAGHIIDVGQKPKKTVHLDNLDRAKLLIEKLAAQKADTTKPDATKPDDSEDDAEKAARVKAADKNKGKDK